MSLDTIANNLGKEIAKVLDLEGVKPPIGTWAWEQINAHIKTAIWEAAIHENPPLPERNP